MGLPSAPQMWLSGAVWGGVYPAPHASGVNNHLC